MCIQDIFLYDCGYTEEIPFHKFLQTILCNGPNSGKECFKFRHNTKNWLCTACLAAKVLAAKPEEEAAAKATMKKNSTWGMGYKPRYYIISKRGSEMYGPNDGQGGWEGEKGWEKKIRDGMEGDMI